MVAASVLVYGFRAENSILLKLLLFGCIAGFFKNLNFMVPFRFYDASSFLLVIILFILAAFYSPVTSVDDSIDWTDSIFFYAGYRLR